MPLKDTRWEKFNAFLDDLFFQNRFETSNRLISYSAKIDDPIKPSSTEFKNNLGIYERSQIF
jgi:hypothetical protein